MAGEERPEVPSPDEIVARIRGFEAAQREIEKAADEQGNLSLSEAYRLIDKLNRSIKYGDKDVLQLGKALDVPEDWYQRLTTDYGQKTPKGLWALVFGLVGAVVVVRTFGRSDYAIGIALCAVAWACYRVGRAEGKIHGYDDGMCEGHAAAVFQAHGVRPDAQKDFWDAYHQAYADKDIAEFATAHESPR